MKVLIVEDVPTDAELILREINKSGYQCVGRTVETRETFLAALKEFDPEIILSDYSLPSFNGMQALLLREQLLPDVPFILVTGANNEEIAVECMKAGADDYIIKNNLTRLGQACKAALAKKAILKSNKEATEKLSILSRAVEQNPALIIITDTQGNIEYVNPKFSQTTGFTPEEIIGQNPRILKSGNQSDEYYKNLWQTILSGKDWNGEFLNKKKNGDLYWENATITPLLNPRGEITHLIGINEDITEKRKMIVDLIHAKEKAEAGDKLKSAFINNISHEIRTPLSTIEGFIEMLLSPDNTEETKASYNQIIRKSSSRLLNTITNYMDISLIVSGNLEVHKMPFSIRQMIEEIRQESIVLCNEKQISLNVSIPAGESDNMLNSDAELVKKIWLHLISNAIKFTPKGEITYGYRNVSNGIQCFVSDTGIGIENDKLQIIFDYFMQADVSQTRAYEGSGLGLSIVRDLVKLLGGHITVESSANAGSTFTFTLSDTQLVKETTILEPAVKPAEPKNNPLILVAEDDDFNYKYLDIILKRAGYLVERAVNGLEAVNYCTRNPGVNLILMDMKMPVMGGLEATRKIKSILPEVPVIALTAYVSVADENAAYDSGCSEFLSKPVNREKLLGLLKRILGTKS